MTALDLDEIRKHRDAYRDAFARVLRAGEPNSDRADDFEAAQAGLFSVAMDAAADVETLLAEIERLRAWNKDVIAQTDIEIGQLGAALRIATAEIARLRGERDDARADVREAGKEIRELEADLRAAYSQIEELP